MTELELLQQIYDLLLVISKSQYLYRIYEMLNGFFLAAGTLSGVVTEEMLSGVLSEVIGLLPLVIPISITFIGLRKGYFL